MKAFVLGIDHSIQYRDDGDQLRRLVSQLCDEHGCDLIAEESSTDTRKHCSTIARSVADAKSLRWLNINIPDRVSEQLGILKDLKRRRTPEPDNEGRRIPEVQSYVYFPRADCMREHRWLRKIMKAQRHNSVLVLCGIIHAKPFAEKLRGASFNVSMSSLCDKAWYHESHADLCGNIERRLTDGRY